MAAVVRIVSEYGFNIDAHHKNQPNKSKLALYKPLICFNSCLKQSFLVHYETIQHILNTFLFWYRYIGGLVSFM